MVDAASNSSVPPFIPGDTSTVSARWKKWKRAFQIFLDVNNVTIPARKNSYLLHYVGLQVQDVFFSLRGEEAPAVPAGSDEFKETMRLLDEYFLPMKCLPLERHKFRNLAQTDDEPIENFVLRLREQGNLCEYGDHLDEEIKEQLFEKGASDDLRAKILNKPQMTLAETVEAGRAMETIEKHKTNTTVAQVPEEIHRVRSKAKKRECYRCGHRGHFANDDNCPAKDQMCKRCGLIGHFKSCCKTKKQKKKVSGKGTRHATAKHHSCDSDDSDDTEKQSGSDSDEDSVQYLFATDPIREGRAVCAVGDVPIEWVIDSGAGVNVVDRRTWEYLKQQKVRVNFQTTAAKRTVKSFTGQPVQITGMFSAEIATKVKGVEAEIYVAEDGECCLLGRRTALDLGILNIDKTVCVTSDSEAVREGSRGTSEVNWRRDLKPVSTREGGCDPYNAREKSLTKYVTFEELLAVR